jgi:PAS domain S-box-containing protein
MGKGKRTSNIKKENNKSIINNTKESRAALESSSFWNLLEKYNNLATGQRLAGLKDIGIIEKDEEILRILTKSHFVIPGKTRYECLFCGECCRYANKIAQFTYESCSFLNEKNMCSKHENHYLVCKWFPFWVYHDKNLGPLLTIKPYCSGYGHGELVDYKETLTKMLELSRRISVENDGAFIIHELLHLPGYKEWVFPSKENIDKLLMLLSTPQPGNNQSEVKTESKGELNYAQFYTSGLLGKVTEPHLTVDEKGIITDVNEAFCQLSHMERDRLVKKKFAQLFVNEVGIASDIQTCFYRGKITAVPHRIILDNKTTLPVLINALSYRDRVDGLIHGVLISMKEISDIIYNELAQSKNYVRGLIEASLDGFMVINLDGTLMDVNQAFINITGYPREKLIGDNFHSYFSSPEEAKRGVSITFQQEQVKNFELDLKTSTNEIIPVSFNASVFHNHDGIVQGIFAVARDIRENRIIMSQLADSKNYARGLIESSIDLMVTVDERGIITDVNEAAVVLTGFSRERLIGSRFREYFDKSECAQESIDKVFRDGKIIMQELTLINSKGDTVPVSFNANVYFNSEGNVQGVFAIARDISERVKMIQQLKDAENYSRNLFESSIDFMVTVNHQGIITDVNEAAVELTGYSRDILINSFFQNYFTEQDRAFKAINIALNSGRVKGYELELISSKNAETIPISFNANGYKDNLGNVAGVFVIARDMR